MEPLTAAPWLKVACFDSLQKSAFSLVDAHPVSDIVALICDELPMDTGAALQEADAISDIVDSSLLNLSNLTPVGN